MAPGRFVLIADEQVTAVPIADRGEPLVDLRAVAGVEVDGRNAEANPLWSHTRASVAERLVRVARLLGDGTRPLVVEGFRPLELQRVYFDRRVERLARAHPDWAPEALRHEASRFVAPPDAVPPHATGGALDLTLVDPGGRELDLGTAVNESPEDCGERCLTAAPELGPGARANRDRLVAAMTAGGFVNYPTEWWHWSYGDRYWALAAGAPTALYGEAPGPAAGPQSSTK